MIAAGSMGWELALAWVVLFVLSLGYIHENDKENDDD